jgi:hypothetical protein
MHPFTTFVAVVPYVPKFGFDRAILPSSSRFTRVLVRHIHK